MATRNAVSLLYRKVCYSYIAYSKRKRTHQKTQTQHPHHKQMELSQMVKIRDVFDHKQCNFKYKMLYNRNCSVFVTAYNTVTQQQQQITNAINDKQTYFSIRLNQ